METLVASGTASSHCQGTFIAGLSILCCSRLRHKNGTKSNVVWVNSYVALLQFLTTFLFLLGWIWSIMWGVAFLSVSEYYKHKDPEHDKKDHNHHHHHHHNEHHHHHGNHQQHHLSKISSIPEDSHTDLVDTDTSNIHSNGTNSSSTPHAYNHTHELYVAPAPPANQTQPMIVLQHPPVNHSDKTKNADPLLVARTRHQKIIQRQMSDNQLSPFNLTHQHLEAIVIHDAPIPRLQRTETIDSTNSSTAAESNGVAVST
ncbi:hypothetical protein LOTGIDRAFT_169804 [Lottia gigantea]|uniref:Uncharacterized protein n=1 Tax=Lottia gigantea TaxID=225164 RepID=V4B3N0_LOTGI|nr:hypothetical protein LOTGIDRAFT_169804 [Lottia gigantea]ESO82979.1 hypothetical protein LOTGIDRAFT_169804 [Lottia gigantea]